MQFTEILGHILGLIGVAAVIASYQFKGKTSIILMQMAGSLLLCIQFLLLGKMTGFALNGMCLLRNIAFYFKNRLGRFEKAVPFICSAAMVVVSIFAWDGWFAVFMMVGLAVNTLCLGLCSPQGLRASLPFTCVLVMIYDFFAGSISGVLNEGLSIISAIVGLVRYKKEKTPSEAKND